MPTHTVAICAGTVSRVLLVAVLSLVTMHAAVMVAKFGFGHDHLLGMTATFDLNIESNVPTWYSSAAFLVTAVTLGVVAAVKRRQRDAFAWHWTILAVMFVYLSLDEVSRLHEHWGVVLEQPLGFLRTARKAGGMFRNLWVIPAGLLAMVVGLIYLRFLRHLPGETRRLFVISGMLFIAGAVGMEMIGSRFSALGLRAGAWFAVLVTIEELLEMGSIVLFLHGVLRYAETTIGAVELRFGTIAAQAGTRPSR
jgi:hypothetical protein